MSWKPSSGELELFQPNALPAAYHQADDHGSEIEDHVAWGGI